MANLSLALCESRGRRKQNKIVGIIAILPIVIAIKKSFLFLKNNDIKSSSGLRLKAAITQMK
ncbi:hypothetical protein PALI_a0884 [Pseudoalteromonas aliena SW19]|uniref:Uncharacterized protein n=1 Tax=Pseudoalteromonas aliena SW19 TaxID=1314866 RepID=A0ABR9E112_9GAMM|nr:hypothetical protein [Pseudoalteromonas aliena SW19]